MYEEYESIEIEFEELDYEGLTAVEYAVAVENQDPDIWVLI